MLEIIFRIAAAQRGASIRLDERHDDAVSNYKRTPPPSSGGARRQARTNILNLQIEPRITNSEAGPLSPLRLSAQSRGPGRDVAQTAGATDVMDWREFQESTTVVREAQGLA